MTNLKPILDYLIYNGLFYLINEPMNRHTTFQIGGPADIVVYPTRRREICDLVRICRAEDIPYISLGNGSNVLVSDAGIRGLVIMTDRMHRITVDNDSRIEAWAGAPLSRVATIAKNYQLSGLEFAFGIPGTIGGAVYMNAGAYNHQMNQVITATEYVDGEGQLCTVEGDDHQFGYRTSCFKDTNHIIVKTHLQLSPGKESEIAKLMKQYTQARKEKQPLELPSAGSAFKRPEGFFAGKLIEDCGLKGRRVGGAEVSTKHAGFIVNVGGAKARDVLDLVDIIKTEVLQKFGVELEPEIKFIG
jgi:UDP-N-acetylmuramate dehydrogenase